MNKRIILVISLLALAITFVFIYKKGSTTTKITPNSYVGFFNARSIDNPKNYYIGYATSSDSINWTSASNPILKPRPKMFDSQMLNGPCPVKVGNNIYVYYSGYNGKKWTTGLTIFDLNMNILYRSKSPILDVGESGSWDSSNIFRVSVSYNEKAEDPNKKFAMLYGGSSKEIYKIGLAYSSDGIKWSKYENNPVLSNGAPGEWDSNWASQPTFTLVDDTYYLAYNGYDGNQITGGLATSQSLEGPWVKSGSNPVLKNRPNATQLLTKDVEPGETTIEISNADVFDLNEPCYLQCSNGTELVRVKSKIDSNTIELYEPTILSHYTDNNAKIESLFCKSEGPNQIVYENGKWKAYCTVFANSLGFESTAIAEGNDLNSLQWNFNNTPIMDFNPIISSKWDSLSQENLRFIKIN